MAARLTVTIRASGPYQSPGGYSAVVFSGYMPSPPPPFPSPSVLLNTSVIDGYAGGTFANAVSYASGAQLVGPNTPTGMSIDPSRILTAPLGFQPVLSESLPGYVHPDLVHRHLDVARHRRGRRPPPWFTSSAT